VDLHFIKRCYSLQLHFNRQSISDDGSPSITMALAMVIFNSRHYVVGKVSVGFAVSVIVQTASGNMKSPFFFILL
jgi:hypothetical protein